MPGLISNYIINNISIWIFWYKFNFKLSKVDKFMITTRNFSYENKNSWVTYALTMSLKFGITKWYIKAEYICPIYWNENLQNIKFKLILVQQLKQSSMRINSVEFCQY
jgi:hypothetical protein